MILWVGRIMVMVIVGVLLLLRVRVGPVAGVLPAVLLLQGQVGRGVFPAVAGLTVAESRLSMPALMEGRRARRVSIPSVWGFLTPTRIRPVGIRVGKCWMS